MSKHSAFAHFEQYMHVFYTHCYAYKQCIFECVHVMLLDSGIFKTAPLPDVIVDLKQVPDLCTVQVSAARWYVSTYNIRMHVWHCIITT